MAYRLTVTTPDKEIFNSYYYGYGRVVNQLETPDGRIETVVDYAEDYYHCEYQAGRFASGLHFATITEL